MKGEYIKNCSCVPGCPCDTHGYPGPNEFCEGVIGMNVKEGDFEGTDLGGVRFVVVVHWPKALHDGNGTAEVYIDESADDKQRQALGQILSGQAGGPIFEILASILTTVHGPHFAPIKWEFDKDARRAHIAVEGGPETTSEPLTIPATEDEQRISVRMPGGFEYKEAEVARATTLKVDGAITFAWQNTHSSLSDVEQTSEGLVA